MFCGIDPSMFIQNIRNFTIISHIDHGKSTLADRFLELTRTVPKEKMQDQYLDKMSLEREHGITIKMHPVRMLYEYSQSQISKMTPRGVAKDDNKSQKSSEIFNFDFYIFNLIDTPGHVDFTYEVSRALAAVEGAVLLVDATKGIQAQTITNLELAQKENLTLLPAINKIDLPQARIKETQNELKDLLKVSEEDINLISAKTGQGVENLISKIIQKVPPPVNNRRNQFDANARIDKNQFKALIFDSKYDQFLGVIVFIRVFGGEINKGDKIYFLRKEIETEVKEVGYFTPELRPAERLLSGEIGYIKTGMKEVGKGWIGDTIIMSNVKCQKSKAKSEKLKVSEVEPFAGYKEPQPKIFASFYPEEPTTFEELKYGLEKLHLTDPSLFFKEERKKALGAGFQCGFLGLLHFEIILERLKREFSLNILTSSPNISYKILGKDNKEYFISSVDEWPDQSKIDCTEEEWINIEIITLPRYFNEIFKLFPLFKANFLSSDNLGQEKLKISANMPFRKFIENFYDKIKSVSQGFSSVSFKEGSWRKSDLAKLNVLILNKEEPTLSKIVSADEAGKEAKDITQKLKEVFPSQLFAVPIQAAVGGKIIARETVKAKRRDVTAPLYGGDVTRKRKLLEKQKKGKRKLADEAQLRVPKEVIIALLKR